MIRTQIQLPDEQVAMLKKMAAARHQSMAEIIRQAVDFFAKTQHSERDQHRRKRAMSAAGQFRSGIKDLAVEHDSHLTEIFGQ